MYQWNKILCWFGIVFLASCKSLKVKSDATLSPTSSLKQIVAIHESKAFQFTTLQSKVKATYFDGKKTVTPSITLKMQKDEKIWMSAKFLGFTVAKILITPTSFSFYEKLGKKYFTGDYALLEKYLNRKVTFRQLQNIFLGQNILPISKGFAVQSLPNKQLAVISENENIKVLFDLLTAKVTNYQVAENQKQLAVEYLGYQKVNNQDFPETMAIKATATNAIGVSEKYLQMQFKNVVLDEKLSFPFTIPSDYSELKLHK